MIKIISYEINNINIDEKNKYLTTLNKIHIVSLLYDKNLTESNLRDIFIKEVLTVPKECGKYECVLKFAKHPNVFLELEQEAADLIAKDIDKKSEHQNILNEIRIDINTRRLFKKLQDKTLTEDKLKEIIEIASTSRITKECKYNILEEVAKHPNSKMYLAEQIRECISNDKTIHEDIKMRSLRRIDSAILKKKEMGDNLQQLKQFGQNIQKASKALSASRTMGK